MILYQVSEQISICNNITALQYCAPQHCRQCRTSSGSRKIHWNCDTVGPRNLVGSQIYLTDPNEDPRGLQGPRKKQICLGRQRERIIDAVGTQGT